MKYKVTLNGVTYEVEVAEGEAILVDEYEAVAAPTPAAMPVVQAAPVSVPMAATPAAVPAPAAVSGEVVASPMPGNIIAIMVQAGMSVKKGETLLLLEAMKMENEIVAPRDATVTQVIVTKGAVVDTGAPLVVLQGA